MSSAERVAICRTKLVFLETVAGCCITTVARITLCWCSNWIKEKVKEKMNERMKKERNKERKQLLKHF